ncbi:MAG: alkaline phosphatase family protein [Pirellulales bacterium]
MRRREFVKLVASAGGGALVSGCGRAQPAHAGQGPRVFLIAFDGLDPRVVQKLLDAGRLPNFARLAKSGTFTKLATSTPPHTPVAFSSIISGADPGVHQVFDFIHRDPQPGNAALPIEPYFSTARVMLPEHQRALSLGSWQLPLSSGQPLLLRRGRAFWDELVAHGVDTTVYFVPSNYPPLAPAGPGQFRSISGMGTPDLLGGYGEFTLFTPDAPRQGRQVGGGRFAFLSMLGNRGRAELIGPANYLRKPSAAGDVPPLTVTLDVVRDPSAPVAKIRMGSATLLLNEGEWSDWIPLVFETHLPGSAVVAAAGAPTSIGGTVRLFLKQVHPKFELYVSPINIDPLAPANPISVPPEFARELAEKHGRFHTVGIPEDTKALSHGALSEAQFLAQTQRVLAERAEQFRAALAEFEQGCLFFYFGDTDLVQHMFWRDRDPEHPGRDKGQAAEFAGVVDDVYTQADGLVGELLAKARDDDTILVFSDHGFTTFRRGFNLNSWLAERGYIGFRGGYRPSDAEMFAGVDWSATRAYGLGLNGLYLNEAGRERFGIVKDAARRSLLAELRDELLAVRDGNGAAAIERVDLAEDLYPGADPKIAPDLFIGYADGYRGSWGTVLGALPQSQFEDNLDRWSGDHSIAANLVPGSLFCNRPVLAEQPSISDLAPTVLAAFGIARPAHMTGRALFESRAKT